MKIYTHHFRQTSSNNQCKIIETLQKGFITSSNSNFPSIMKESWTLALVLANNSV